MSDCRISPFLAAFAAVGALVLTGCSGGESANDADAVVATTPAGVSDTSTPTATTSPTGPASVKSQTPAGDADVALTAIATAVTAVPGSRAFAYERDERDRYIEVTVLDEASVERVVVLDIGGASVTRTENEGRLDASDLAEFNAATVELVDAIATAAASSPGVLHDADLDDRKRVLVWELEIQDGGRTNTVWVDAKSGKITP